MVTVAERFSVNAGFIKKMLHLKHTTVELAPRTHGNGRRASLTHHQRQQQFVWPKPQPIKRRLIRSLTALHLVTKADCLGWFSHCGYQKLHSIAISYNQASSYLG